VNLPEHELLQALAEGDINAFEMYFKSYYQSLCSYAWSYLKDTEEAEEVVQNTFVSMWEKRDTLNIQTSAKSYLYAMVRNACLNLIKHQKIKQKYVGEELALATDGYESVTHEVSSRELEVRISNALETLPEQCRLVFKLSRFEELKYAEIAAHLNISVKTVENHMGKALRLMREQLKDYLPLIITTLTAFLSGF